MKKQRTHSVENRLEALLHQLHLNEKILQKHPAFQGKGVFLQTLLFHLQNQIQRSLLKSSGSLLFAVQAALYAQEVGQSQTGFLGLSMQHLQKLVTQLVSICLKAEEQKAVPLLMACLQIFVMAAIFIFAYLKEEWNTAFSKIEDPCSVKKSGELLQELGALFIFKSRLIESALYAIAEKCTIKEKNRKNIIDISICLLLILTMLLQDEKLQEPLQDILLASLNSIETVIQENSLEDLLNKDQITQAIQQLHLTRQALIKKNDEEFKQILHANFDLLGISLQEIKKDLEHLKVFCLQLNKSFKNIFESHSVAMSLIQTV